MSIVWSSRLSKARISLSVTFLWETTEQDVRAMHTGMWYRIIMSGAKESNRLCFTVAEGKPTAELTWGNRTCKCRDSWPHQSRTTKPWVWLQLHQHDWLAAQWTGCLNKRKQMTEKSHHGLSFYPTPLRKFEILLVWEKRGIHSQKLAKALRKTGTGNYHVLDSGWEMGLPASRRNTWR